MGYGCEMRAKSSTLYTMLPEAEATGRCEIRPHSYVTRIDTEIRAEVEQLAATRAWSHAVDPQRFSPGARASLEQYAYLVRRLGKGTGTYQAQRRSEIRAAMDRLLMHLGTLASGLVGILRSVRESPDSASTAEAISDLVESLDKYARVGTWLCQGLVCGNRDLLCELSTQTYMRQAANSTATPELHTCLHTC